MWQCSGKKKKTGLVRCVDPSLKADVGQLLLVSTKLGKLLVLSSCPLQVIVRFLRERTIAPIEKDCGCISRLRRNL